MAQKNVVCGNDCSIHPLADLENVVLQDNVQIGRGVHLHNVRIGSNTKISNNVTIYTHSPDLVVEIGSNVWISAGVFCEGTGGKIIIEDHAVVAHFTTILTSSGPGGRNPVMESLFPTQLGNVFVGRYSWIGAHSTFLPGAVLIEGVVIGSNSLVRRGRYEAFTIYAGTPAKIIRTIDKAQVEKIKREFNLTNDNE
jgi:acetyltransferase-like isoleucine patch superfamily enzyme